MESATPRPGTTQVPRYLGNESQDPHLAGLVAGSQAPQKLILRRAAVGDLLVLQVSERETKTLLASHPADPLWNPWVL